MTPREQHLLHGMLLTRHHRYEIIVVNISQALSKVGMSECVLCVEVYADKGALPMAIS